MRHPARRVCCGPGRANDGCRRFPVLPFDGRSGAFRSALVLPGPSVVCLRLAGDCPCLVGAARCLSASCRGRPLSGCILPEIACCLAGPPVVGLCCTGPDSSPSSGLFEVDDFGAGRTVAVLFQPGGVRDAEVVAVDEPALPECDAEPDLDRVEDESFVPQADTDSERGE